MQSILETRPSLMRSPLFSTYPSYVDMDQNDSFDDADPRHLNTITLAGREFQNFTVRNNIHFRPIDEGEAWRLDAQHEIFNYLFDGRNIFPPLTKLENVLDLGYGTGAWAAEIAEKYPECRVSGVDITSNMLREDTPDNFQAEVADLNTSLNFPSNHFDLIQSRLVGGGINRGRWASYVGDILKSLKPGGWCQMIEYYVMCQSDNGLIDDDSVLRKWSLTYMDALATTKDPRAPMQMSNMLMSAGMINVESKMIPVPLSPWPSNEREKKIGELQSKIIEDTFRSLSLYPFLTQLGMNQSTFDDLIRRATKEAVNQDLKAYFPLYVCIGQRPPL